jgi:hypothetical protein
VATVIITPPWTSLTSMNGSTCMWSILFMNTRCAQLRTRWSHCRCNHTFQCVTFSLMKRSRMHISAEGGHFAGLLQQWKWRLWKVMYNH